MKILLVISFVLLVIILVFCLWVLAKISGLAIDMEEQMEIERKLRNDKRNNKDR